MTTPIPQRRKTRSERLTNLPKEKHLLKWVSGSLEVKVKLRRSQREEAFRGGLGTKRLLSWGNEKFVGSHDLHIRRPWLRDSSLTSCPVALHISKDHVGMGLLWLYHLALFLSRDLWSAVGCFSNNKGYTSDLMINLVHDSSNLSIWMLKLPLHKYQTTPSTDTSNKHKFWCMRTISALGLWRRPFPRLIVS